MMYDFQNDPEFRDYGKCEPKFMSTIILRYFTDDGLNSIGEVIRYTGKGCLRTQERLSGGKVFWRYRGE